MMRSLIEDSEASSAVIDPAAPESSAAKMQCRVAFLTSTFPPAEKAFFLALQERFSDFRLFLSSPQEAKNLSSGHWDDLHGTVQKSLKLRRESRHPIGFSAELPWDIPWDTLIQLARCRPELVISAELGFRSLFAALYRAIHPRSRLILWAPCSEHTERERGRLRTLARRLLLRFPDAVLVNAVSGRRYMEAMGVAANAIFYVPRTVGLKRFAAIPLERAPRSARRLLFVGQLIERKGLRPFLLALDRWARLNPEREIELWIVGDGPLRNELETVPLANGVSVKSLGSKPNSEVPKVFEQSGILVFPTLSDEWGLVVNEAFAAGLPVLGSRYSEAVEEMVETGVTGWKFRTDHAEEMDMAIDQAMCASDEQLDLMRIAARERVAAFAPEKIADRVLSAARLVMRTTVGEIKDGKIVGRN
jgi:glycosyltransferase involved in cell wall biosynthesis